MAHLSRDSAATDRPIPAPRSASATRGGEPSLHEDSLEHSATNHSAQNPFHFQVWDAGRLQVNQAFADLLRQHGLTTFAALMQCNDGPIARQMASRTTRRLTLSDSSGQHAFYLKQHVPPRMWERVKPLLHLRQPIFGAEPEWQAILRFHAAGLPTMVPVAWGKHGGRSLLLTQALDGYRDLRDWLESTPATSAHRASLLATLSDQIADIARAMHAAGLHHQDFYFDHLLVREDQLSSDGPTPASNPLDLRVIDLGRVRHTSPLAPRWIVKDLAQLNFSARQLPCSLRLRFLRRYLNRPFRPADRRLITRIAAKARNIERHTARHAL